MTDLHSRAAIALMAYDPSSPVAWPDDLKAPGVAWLEDVAFAMHSASMRSSGSSAFAVRRSLASSLGDAAHVVALTERLASERGARCVGVWSSAAFVLSAADADSFDVDEAKTRASIRLLELALPSLEGAARVAASVRLARLYEATGDDAASARAWTIAIRERPLIAWMLPKGEWRLEDEAEIRASELGRALLDYDADPARANDAIGALARGGDSDAALVRAAGHLRIAALAEPRSESAAREIAAGRALLAAIEDPVPRALLAAMFAIVEGDRERARTELGGLATLGDPSESAIVDALSEMLMRPPRDPREILRTAWFEARIDPLVAFGEPRSAFAPLRKLLFGATLAVVLFSAASAARANTTAPETAPVAGAVATEVPSQSATAAVTPQSPDATTSDTASAETPVTPEVTPEPEPPPPLDEAPKIRPSFAGKTRWGSDGH
jgi:hypothetical protein